ncbi:hypothetical protein JMM34_004159 [Salmonella enterica]|uniref:Uncharacterized protein n=8 Tax=Salmonella enterica TaxID=28901 RepID=A0A5Y4NCX1_SALER|nr:hypothetical protein [Salmonella enterica]EAA9213456.1 hypothetical protein [Salmonella enterica subsp. enterica serovar Agama]EAS6775404.1 hypothetical protein [Salmonella enterica subsp. enterica serovar Give]EBG8068918.1 hypothetical protein [Salmonella enterica subsp. enterica serovar Elisabethville]EBH9098480.1 hypothetical protein [Salmonella enterica subsp. enterica serovar Colindale]EBW6149979.1 hypothetical protein [Salmonella enterica subsp. enterica serovar Cremieu]EBW7792021.1 
MPTIKSRMIRGVKPNEETLKELQEQLGLSEDTDMMFMALEVDYDRKKYYCCLSGGKIENGDVHFSLVGRAALEVLMNHPSPNDTLTIQEIKIGPTPLKNKVKSILKKAEANSKICFVGDMQGELDGVLSDVFNIQKDESYAIR